MCLSLPTPLSTSKKIIEPIQVVEEGEALGRVAYIIIQYMNE